MLIKVWDDKYIIKSDPRCYIVAELKSKPSSDDRDDAVENEDGIYEVNHKYYGSMTQVFKYIVESEGRKNKCTTLEGYIKHIEKIEKKLEETLLQIQAVIGQKESLKRIIDTFPGELSENVKNIGENENKKKGAKKK